MIQILKIITAVALQMREPKSTYRLDDINIALVPNKLDNPNAMQIIHSQNGATRNLFVYAETGQVGGSASLILRHTGLDSDNGDRRLVCVCTDAVEDSWR